MITIKAGGVPEHFNLPWHLAIEDGAFKAEGVDLIWTDQPGGTGQMTKALRSGELDVAVLLTEGIVADIIKGNASLLIQQYVRSPLIWGIHAPANSRFQSIADIKEARFAISRNGSGSHIMAYVFAEQQGWNPGELKFVKVGNFEGARTAFKNNEADILLWEKFMTKPFVDDGELKRVGETITPWSCFMIAANKNALAEKRTAIIKTLSIIRKYCDAFMNREDAVDLVVQRYQLLKKDAHAWFRQTGWSTNNYVSKKMLADVMNTLHDVNVIAHKLPVETLCDDMLWFDQLVN